MDGADVLGFWAVSILFVLIPGADWAYAISAGLRGRVVAPAVAGMLAGHLGATLLVAAGVGALVARAPGLLGGLTIAGGVYLVWLGFLTFTRPATPQESAEASTGSSRARWWWKGLGVSGLNPKVFLLFLALLPQFTSRFAPWPVPAQIMVLGLIHVATCAVVYLAVAVTARRLLSARPAGARIISRVSGAVVVGLGVALIVEQLLR
ncbi:LysE family translocator [uncultured Cellulomonas sp.]|uniref:LysE family translocator n=1 Tax=uncultured Cellulomonas sp. TaxID=189682 RepID=UPI0028E850AF|nr:LysE family translocator [uncultured Cellulomonas sp.]